MQAYDRVSIARAKGRPTALKFIGAIFEDFFEPVSYTHLDVYKRQGHGFRTSLQYKSTII